MQKGQIKIERYVLSNDDVYRLKTLLAAVVEGEVSESNVKAARQIAHDISDSRFVGIEFVMKEEEGTR